MLVASKFTLLQQINPMKVTLNLSRQRKRQLFLILFNTNPLLINI